MSEGMPTQTFLDAHCSLAVLAAKSSCHVQGQRAVCRKSLYWSDSRVPEPPPQQDSLWQALGVFASQLRQFGESGRSHFPCNYPLFPPAPSIRSESSLQPCTCRFTRHYVPEAWGMETRTARCSVKLAQVYSGSRPHLSSLAASLLTSAELEIKTPHLPCSPLGTPILLLFPPQELPLFW